MVGTAVAAQLGHKHSPETRAKLSAASKGKKKSPEHVAAMRAARLRKVALTLYPIGVDDQDTLC